MRSVPKFQTLDQRHRCPATVQLGIEPNRYRRMRQSRITFQMAEVAVPRALRAEILRLIDGLRPALLPP